MVGFDNGNEKTRQLDGKPNSDVVRPRTNADMLLKRPEARQSLRRSMATSVKTTCLRKPSGFS
jgi:hypothetical protein